MILLTGCWDREELGQLAIVSALGIDVGSSPGTVLISAQVIRPGETGSGYGQNGSGGGRPFGVITVEGTSLFNAIRKATTLSSRRLYLAHCEVIVLGNEYARQGIRPAVDFIMRDPEFRADTKMLVATGEAREVIHAVTQFEQVPGMELCDMVLVSWANSSIGVARIFDVYTSLLSPSTNPIATWVDTVTTATIDRKVIDSGTPVSPIEGDREKRNRLIGTAIFRDDKLIGHLDLTASRGYRFIMNEIVSGIVLVQAEDGSRVELEIFSTHSKVSAEISPQGPQFMLDIRTTAGVGSVSGAIDVADIDILKELEQVYSQAIEDEVQLALSTAQSLGADIFGFGSVLERKNPKYWREIKDNWQNMFAQITLEVSVEPRIMSYGKITRSPLPKED